MSRNVPLPRGITQEQIEETRSVFQPYYKEPLTDEECLDMILRVYCLFDVFKEIDDRLARESAARGGQSGK